MAKEKADFVDTLGRSGLLEKAQIAAALEEFAAQHRHAVGDNKAVADFFVHLGLLTRWQAGKILEGRYKAFFLSKYRLLDHLGTGGMSSVYLAEHTLMRRQVAIKVLPHQKVSDPAYLNRFYHEAQAAGQLHDPNIVHTYDIDNDGNTHFIVMEYVPGKNLAELVKAEGPLGARRAANYVAQAADGLQHAHDVGLVHRDVKPANLLLDEKDTIKIVDLGLAYFNIEGQTSLTLASEDNVLGTADYLAPEQAINSHNVDARADIYSLGCTLYFLLTGHPPFDEGPIAQRLLAHQTQAPPSIFKDRPTAPRELVAICDRMMAKKPEERYQSAAEVAGALRDWLANAGDASGSTPRLRRLEPQDEGRGSSSRLRASDSGLKDRLGPSNSSSSVFGRDLRPQSGSKSGEGRKLPGATPAKNKLEAEELELAVLDEGPGHSKSQTKKSSASSTSGGKSSSEAGPTKPPGSSVRMEKPKDFASWFEEELSRPDPLLRSGEYQVHGRSQPAASNMFWVWLAVGIGATLLLSVALVFFLL